MTHPWGVAFAAGNAPKYHFLASGPCWIGTEDEDWVRLEPGDAVLLPRRIGHVIASAKGGRTVPFETLTRAELGDATAPPVQYFADGDTTSLFCCRFTFEGPYVEHLLELMPPILLFRGAAKSDRMLPALLETMAAEIGDERMGSATVLSRLADVVITRVVRVWAEEHRDDATGLLAAIHDPKIARALSAIHRNPGRDWTVEALASEAGASRSVFTERFAELVGVTPARYLARLRMHLAEALLRTGELGVGEVAKRLGYDSEASFSRAFKRQSGMSPSEFRRSTSERSRTRLSLA